MDELLYAMHLGYDVSLNELLKAAEITADEYNNNDEYIEEVA